MRELSDSVTATRVKNNLVVTLPADLSASVLEQLRQVALGHVHEKRVRAVIFECSAVHYMDRYEFEQLCVLFRVVDVLGSQPCFVGMRAGIVKYLVQSDADCSGIKAFLDLNEALDHFSGAGDAGVDHAT